MKDNNDFKLWDEFLANWPLSSVKQMRLEQYTNVGDKTTFTYWLEHVLQPYGSIKGGSAEKFGIFNKKNKDATPKSHLISDENYTWNRKYGESPQQAFEKIRYLLIDVIKFIQLGDLSSIESIDLPPTLKWKIAFHYQNRQKPLLVAIFSEGVFDTYFNKKTSIIEASELLQGELSEDNLMSISTKIWQQWDKIKNINIWKISLGRDVFSDEEVNEFDKYNQIAIYDNTPKNQNNEFKNKAKIGDFVYITRSNGIYALAKITSDCIQEKNSSLLIREYKLIKRLPKPVEYDGLSKGWTPNYRSTFYKVKVTDLTLFEATILRPHFDYSLDDLENEMTLESEMPTMPKNLIKSPLNQILYGPPGTGKTYHTINKALEIIDEDIDDKDRDKIKQLFDEKVALGQIVFTTFHQSQCYEDFIEGIKPILDDNNEQSQIGYQIEDGTFKQLCTNAAYEFAKGSTSGKVSEVTDFALQYDLFIEGIEEKLPFSLLTRTENKILIVAISDNNNLIIQHTNGTKNYIVSKNRLTKLNAGIPNWENVTNINVVCRDIIGGCNASAYWAVLNAIKKMPQHKQSILNTTNYADKKGIINLLENSDYQDKRVQPYVLIIDEINRGNVSQIFGELITLIEEDKRIGNNEALKVTLPYSKERFGVPKNLYIIGTMNTADRSVEALDTALRRRFNFTEMLPDPTLLNAELNIDGQTIDLQKILTTINQRIEILLDRDHQIGHSYFINTKDTTGLCNAFNNKIVPLLQEYFFNDYAKIGLVLGSGFIDVIDNNSTVKFAAFDDSQLASQYEDKVIYRLNRVNEDSIIAALNAMGIEKTDD